MPELRRHFADSLPGRLGKIERGMKGIRGGEDLSSDAGREFFLAVHSLAGTAPAVGGEEIGLLGRRMSHLLRAWGEAGTLPSPDEVDSLEGLLTELRTHIDRYTAWVRLDDSDEPDDDA